jgi:hypothetical protein
MIWRPIMAGKVSFGEVKRGDITLAELFDMNTMIDFEAAVQAKAKEDAERDRT